MDIYLLYIMANKTVDSKRKKKEDTLFCNNMNGLKNLFIIFFFSKKKILVSRFNKKNKTTYFNK